jgi:hypothetical protein
MSTLEVRAHGFHPLRTLKEKAIDGWKRLGEEDNPDAEVVLESECSEEQYKYLKDAEKSVEFYDIAKATSNAGGAGSKKSINRESNEQQKVQTSREDKSDDFIR